MLLGGFLLDTWWGDPRRLPHLIVGYGQLISFAEKRLNRDRYLFVKGMLLTLLYVSLSFTIPFVLKMFLYQFGLTYLWVGIGLVLLFYCLANKTLVKEGYAVFSELNTKGLAAGRQRLSWIVGRDTSNLSAHQIRTATFETMSENLSDGVIAPLFYFAILGVPGAMAYKMINTFDSMIGYKNDRYEKFGKSAAKLDDLANLIPARLTAFLMLLVSFKIQGIGVVVREGKKHTSPNAGYPEAALAYILNCQFGGPNVYGGKIVEKPFIGTKKRDIKHQEIRQVAFINYSVTLVMVLLITGIIVCWA